jgi:hypothetical protein
MSFIGVLERLADDRAIKILKVFAGKPDAKFTMAEIQKKTKLPAATTFRQLKYLSEKGFLDVEAVKHLHIYKLGRGEHAQTMASLLYEHPEPLRLFLERVEVLDGVEEIMMHGKSENGANLVVVGHGVNKAPINDAVALAIDRYSYKINHLVVEPEQYETMANMGLYPSNRIVLYRKL